METVNPEYVMGFVVEIRNCSNDTGVGTGFLVYPDSKIITCSHVLKEAGVDLDDVESTEIFVRFPDRKGRKNGTRKAKVVAFLDNDDVALLKLVGKDPSPLGPNQLALLGIVKHSQRRKFISYGCKSLYPGCPGLHADGVIMGPLPIGDNAELLCERIQIKSDEIDTGMSGAPVTVLNGDKIYRVVGVVVAINIADENQKNKSTSYAVDTLIFTHEPFKSHIKIYDVIPYQIKDPMPRADMSTVTGSISPNLNFDIDKIPPVPDPWIERSELMKAIEGSWVDEKTKLISFVGSDGIGKTSLVNKWVKNLLIRWDKPKAVFWWSFEDCPNPEEFFETALDYMGGGKIDQIRFKSTDDKMDFLATMVLVMSKHGRCLFILDGLNAIQHYNGDEYGCIKNGELRQFISYLSRFGYAIATSSIPLLDFVGCPGHIQHGMTRLSDVESKELLQKIGVNDSHVLDKVTEDCKGVPLMLSVTGRSLVVDASDGATKKAI